MTITIIEVNLSSGVITPEELQRLGELFAQALARADAVAEVIISGRMPVWAFAHLVLVAREAREGLTIATFDPRLNAGVIVWPASSAGQLLPVTGEEQRREIVI